jgi:hypothetical protein
MHRDAAARVAFIAAIAMHVVAAVAAAVQPPPAELTALAAKAHASETIAAWCRGEFRPGRPGAFAAALGSGSGGGRYVVFESDGGIEALASFARGADLSCYTRAEANRLAETIRRSDTIHGHLAPRWNTTIVCGFVDDTNAVCWQYSPADRALVKIGEWVT